MSQSLKGKSAIITGASRGIGQAIARTLAKQGVRLAFLGRAKPTVRGKFIRCDLGDSAAVPAAVRAALRHLGGCDFLVNNAGTFHEAPVAQLDLADWDRVLRVNVTGAFLVTRAVLPGMIRRRRGRIINIASTASHQGYLHQAAYVASKHALLGFARALALETRPHGIRVHSVCPGGVDTDLLKGTYLGQRLAGQPLIRPADIAALVLVLLRQPPAIDLPELVIRRFSP